MFRLHALTRPPGGSGFDNPIPVGPAAGLQGRNLGSVWRRDGRRKHLISSSEVEKQAAGSARRPFSLRHSTLGPFQPVILERRSVCMTKKTQEAILKTNRRNFMGGVSAAAIVSSSSVAFGQKKYDEGAT